jgi:hypothetical protein
VTVEEALNGSEARSTRGISEIVDQPVEEATVYSLDRIRGLHV